MFIRSVYVLNQCRADRAGTCDEFLEVSDYLGSQSYFVEVNTEEAIMAKAADKSVFTRDIDELVERIDREWQYEHYCNYLRSILKPDAAEMVIAIVLDGLTVSEYAERISDEPNNVSHRYRRAINKLKKVFSKTSF